jgi:hypothetical protein
MYACVEESELPTFEKSIGRGPRKAPGDERFDESAEPAGLA